jgi:hypothetical protein
MGRYVSIGSYWLGSACAALGLFARALDIVGKNFIDFDTKGGAISYHTLMDGTIFFYAISIATMMYTGFDSQRKSEPSVDRESEEPKEMLYQK